MDWPLVNCLIHGFQRTLQLTNLTPQTHNDTEIYQDAQNRSQEQHASDQERHRQLHCTQIIIDRD